MVRDAGEVSNHARHRDEISTQRKDFRNGITFSHMFLKHAAVRLLPSFVATSEIST